MTDIDPIYRPRQAGDYLGGVSPSTLAKWRMTGRGPEFVRIGQTLVGYRRSALDRFASARRSTSQSAPAASAEARQ